MRQHLALPYRVVDAFTARPFSGNPAAVVLPDPKRPFRTLPDALLQAIAGEMNLSETAFPDLPGEDGIRPLRWFTPATEVSLCGHATLAAAHAILESSGEQPPLRFGSRSGPLEVIRAPEGRLGLDFPADPPEPAPPPPGLLDALGVPGEAEFLRARRCGVVRLEEEEEVRTLRPDLPALGRIDLPDGMMGVSVTAPGSDAEVDFVSRFFGPWVGVDEDPVTGMAHTALAPYWSRELGMREMEARQRSRRGGGLRVRWDGERVLLLGEAVTVALGTLRIPA